MNNYFCLSKNWWIWKFCLCSWGSSAKEKRHNKEVKKENGIGKGKQCQPYMQLETPAQSSQWVINQRVTTGQNKCMPVLKLWYIASSAPNKNELKGCRTVLKCQHMYCNYRSVCFLTKGNFTELQAWRTTTLDRFRWDMDFSMNFDIVLLMYAVKCNQ